MWGKKICKHIHCFKDFLHSDSYIIFEFLMLAQLPSLTLNNRALLQDLATPVPHFYQHYFGLHWKNMIFSCVALVSYIKLPVFLSFPLMTALFPPQMLLPEAAHHWPNLNKVINLLSCMFTESLFGFDGIPQGHNSRHLNCKSLIK